MKTEITSGKWIETAGIDAKYWLVGVPNNSGFSTVATVSATIDGTSLANARLIAEAGTVTNETGFTPRQLAEVLAKAKQLVLSLDHDNLNKYERECADELDNAINNA